jgi:hypothetical protein
MAKPWLGRNEARRQTDARLPQRFGLGGVVAIKLPAAAWAVLNSRYERGYFFDILALDVTG